MEKKIKKLKTYRQDTHIEDVDGYVEEFIRDKKAQGYNIIEICLLAIQILEKYLNDGIDLLDLIKQISGEIETHDKVLKRLDYSVKDIIDYDMGKGD